MSPLSSTDVRLIGLVAVTYPVITYHQASGWFLEEFAKGQRKLGGPLLKGVIRPWLISGVGLPFKQLTF